MKNSRKIGRRRKENRPRSPCRRRLVLPAPPGAFIFTSYIFPAVAQGTGSHISQKTTRQSRRSHIWLRRPWRVDMFGIKLEVVLITSAGYDKSCSLCQSLNSTAVLIVLLSKHFRMCFWMCRLNTSLISSLIAWVVPTSWVLRIKDWAPSVPPPARKTIPLVHHSTASGLFRIPFEFLLLLGFFSSCFQQPTRPASISPSKYLFESSWRNKIWSTRQIKVLLVEAQSC